MLTLAIQSLEEYFLTIEGVIAFLFSTEIPWRFIQVVEHKIELLHFFINWVIKSLFAITWTIPEFYGIIVIFGKEFSEFTGNWWSMSLKWVWQWIKYSFSSVDKVSNDNNLTNVRQLSSLVDATSDSKKSPL